MFAGPLKFLLKGVLGALWLLCAIVVIALFANVFSMVLPYTGLSNIAILAQIAKFGQGFGGYVISYVKGLSQGFISNLIDSALSWDSTGIFSSVAYLILGALIAIVVYKLIKLGLEAVTGDLSYSSLLSGFSLDTIESLLGFVTLAVVLIGGLNGTLGSTDLFVGLFLLGFGIYMNHLRKTTFAKNVFIGNIVIGVLFAVFVLALAPVTFTSMVFGLLPDGDLTTLASNSVAQVSGILPKTGLRYVTYVLAFSWIFVFLMNPSHQGKH